MRLNLTTPAHLSCRFIAALLGERTRDQPRRCRKTSKKSVHTCIAILSGANICVKVLILSMWLRLPIVFIVPQSSGKYCRPYQSKTCHCLGNVSCAVIQLSLHAYHAFCRKRNESLKVCISLACFLHHAVNLTDILEDTSLYLSHICQYLCRASAQKAERLPQGGWHWWLMRNLESCVTGLHTVTLVKEKWAFSVRRRTIWYVGVCKIHRSRASRSDYNSTYVQIDRGLL